MLMHRKKNQRGRNKPGLTFQLDFEKHISHLSLFGGINNPRDGFFRPGWISLCAIAKYKNLPSCWRRCQEKTCPISPEKIDSYLIRSRRFEVPAIILRRDVCRNLLHFLPRHIKRKIFRCGRPRNRRRPGFRLHPIRVPYLNEGVSRM